MGYLGTPIDTTNQFQSLSSKQFNGDGTTTDFTLDIAPGSVNDIEVFVGNVRQDPHSAYTLSGTTLSFTGAPPSGTNNIYVVHQAKAVSTITPATNTVTNDMLVGSIANSKLANSSITLNGSAVSLGGSASVDNTPQFLATSSSTAISNTSHVAIINGTEVFDSNSLYNTSDGKFTVTASTTGYYFFYGGVGFALASGSRMQASIYLNGSVKFKTEMYASSSYPSPIVSGVLNLSSSGDYVQLYCYQNTGSTNTLSGEAEKNFFGGFKLIT